MAALAWSASPGARVAPSRDRPCGTETTRGSLEAAVHRVGSLTVAHMWRPTVTSSGVPPRSNMTGPIALALAMGRGSIFGWFVIRTSDSLGA